MQDKQNQEYSSIRDSLDAYADLASMSYMFNNIKYSALDKKEFTQTDMLKQMALIQEEIQELETAKENWDLTKQESIEEILDAYVDILVTTMGLMQMLEHQGVDVSRAMRATGSNNLSKYIALGDTPMQHNKELIASMAKYRQPEYVSKLVLPFLNKDFNMIVLLDKNDKVCKPANFKPNDLSLCFSNFKGVKYE